MKKILLICIACFVFKNPEAQVRIGGSPITPHESAVLELDGGSTRGLLLPRMRKPEMLAIPDPAEGLVVYVTDEKAIYLRRQLEWVKISGSSDFFSLPYSNSFNVPTPVLSLTNTAPNSSAIVGSDLGIVPGFGVRGFSLNGIGINGVGTSSGAYGGYFINEYTNGRSLVSLGRTGIGTSTPGNLLHIDGNDYPGTTVIINDDTDPLIQLDHGGVSVGFLQTVADDLKIGTNATNNNGRFIVRTNGADRLFVDNAGQTGIGAASPGSRFYIDALGTAAIAMTINDQNPTLQLQNSGVDKGFLQLNGDDIRLGANNGNTNGKVVLRTNGIDRVHVDNAGYVQVGPDPNFKLGMVNIVTPAADQGQFSLNLVSDAGSQFGPSILFQKRTAAESLGFIRMEPNEMIFESGGLTSAGYDFRCGLNTALAIDGTNRYVRINERLRVGVSGFAEATLHVEDFTVTGQIAKFAAQEPIIQIGNIDFNVNPSHFNVGFLQAVGHDFKIGTNAGNTGDFVIRTNGADRAFMKSNGNMYIGGTGDGPAGGHKLAVRGRIAATEFDVVAIASWPDYVFDPTYKLMSLPDVEAFIKKNKHLPNILPAALVEKEGYGLADMQKRMMEKIEELTLHLIDADKKIKELTEKVSKLEEK